MSFTDTTLDYLVVELLTSDCALGPQSLDDPREVHWKLWDPGASWLCAAALPAAQRGASGNLQKNKVIGKWLPVSTAAAVPQAAIEC